MTDKELRAEIIVRLKDGRLPANLPIPMSPGTFDLGKISIGGDKCSACDGDKPFETHTLTSGKTISFHQRCKEIWNEERGKFRSKSN